MDVIPDRISFGRFAAAVQVPCGLPPLGIPVPVPVVGIFGLLIRHQLGGMRSYTEVHLAASSCWVATF